MGDGFLLAIFSLLAPYLPVVWFCIQKRKLATVNIRGEDRYITNLGTCTHQRSGNIKDEARRGRLDKMGGDIVTLKEMYREQVLLVNKIQGMSSSRMVTGAGSSSSSNPVAPTE